MKKSNKNTAKGKKRSKRVLIKNKKAYFNYELVEKIEAGIVLSGSEAKGIRNKGCDLSEAFAKIIGGEAFLINANISVGKDSKENSTRSRKLLLHKKEIISIMSKIKAKKLTLIPTKLYNKGRNFKIELALAKYKKKVDRRKKIKDKDIKRQIQRELKEN